MEQGNIKDLIRFRDSKMKDYAQTPNEKHRGQNGSTGENTSQFSKICIRNEFSRDRDRIKFSRAFRRLQHKAQIYSHEKGDHFRTRLTHTLEVVQIAKSIAKNLNLNEDLVEAIALGHDIGHAPFGHQGERTLDDIMSGKDNLSGKFKYKINYGGFKHSYHSLKILDQLEIKYKNIKGMNLTWQVLEGILKHTKIKRHDKCNNCNGCWDISKFINKENNNKSFLQKSLNYDFSITLEGQIVAVADEIAQRQHDVDDGLRDKDLKLDFEDVATHLVKEFERIIKEYNGCNNIFAKNLTDLKESIRRLTNLELEEKQLYKINTLVRNLVDYFIKDVTLNSLKNLSVNLRDDDIVEEDSKKYFTKRFIYFSDIGKQVNDIIEKFIKTKILNSYNVNRFDGKAIYIIKQLFKAYYTNPRQMPEYILQRLLEKIDGITKNIYNLKFLNGVEVKKVNFLNSRQDEVNKLIKLIKLEIRPSELDIPQKFKEKLEKCNYIDRNDNFTQNAFDSVLNRSKRNIYKEECIIKALLEINYAYISSICDYIAGMTDNYAKDEFKKLYLVD